MKFKFKSLLLGVAICSIGSSMVYAGTSYSSYNTTVGRFNGSGYTGYQTKTTSGANGNLRSKSVGGSYVVDARMIESNGTAASWRRNITDNKNYALDGHYSHKKGDRVRVQFSNDLTTPVNVQVTGSWKSN